MIFSKIFGDSKCCVFDIFLYEKNNKFGEMLRGIVKFVVFYYSFL